MPVRLLDTNIVSFVLKAHPLAARYVLRLADFVNIPGLIAITEAP
jgi:hypothetical protein